MDTETCSSARAGDVTRRSGPRRLLAGISLAVAAAMAIVQMDVIPARAEVVAGAPKYTIEDLGAVGFDSYGTGINASGQVSGRARIAGISGTSAYHAIRWTGTTMTDLGDLGELGCGAEGRAIANDGTVVGQSNVTCAESDVHGFRSTPEGLNDIGSLGFVPTRVNGASAEGRIVGSSRDDRGIGRAFVTDPFGLGMVAIDSLAKTKPQGALAQAAYGVNAAGDVVGYGYFYEAACGGRSPAFLYSGGQLQFLPGPNAVPCFGGTARAINDSGVIVGDGEVYGVTPLHAFRSQAGVTEDIGARLPAQYGISYGYGVNASGTAVGAAKGCNICIPVAWVDSAVGGMQVLNDLIDPAVGWYLTEATGINASGQITGSGTHNGVYHAYRLTPVERTALTSIAVSPATPTLQKGSTQAFTATGTFSDGGTANLTGRVSWSSSNPAVATIAPTGVAGAVAPGTTTISAASGSVAGSTVLTVAVPTLSSIAVVPRTATVRPGRTLQFSATGKYSDGSTADLTTAVTWSSSKTSVATVSVGGQARGIAVGTTTITATRGSLSGTARLDVAQPALSSITVRPANATVQQGGSLAFSATGVYSDGSTIDLSSSVVWSSSNTAVATVARGGVATASAWGVGMSKITATYGSISGTTTLTVRATVAV